MFKDVFSEVPNGTFAWCLLHGVPLVFLEVVRCMVQYGVATSLWSSSCPCLVIASSYSLSLMFVCVFILWSVVICVWDINILIIASRMFLFGWLLCKVGCLIWVLRSIGHYDSL